MAEISELQQQLTDLSRAQDALRDREARLRLMVEQIPAILWTTDKDLRFTSVLGAALKGVDVTAGEVVGQRLDEYLRRDNPSFPPTAALRRALDGESVAFELEWRGRVFQAYVEPLRDAKAAVVGTLGVALDITERRLLEDDLKEVGSALESRVRERMKEADAARTALEVEIAARRRAEADLRRSNSELDMFASVASHDLQEPLRKIRAFGDQLRRRHGEKLDAEGRDYLERMTRAADRMSRLISELLAFARIGASDRPYESVDLNAVIDDILLDLEPRISACRAHVEVGPLPAVMGDRMQLRQLFEALLTNALKFRELSRPPRVMVRGERLGPTAAVTIEDNGIGFEERYLEKIFKPFTRLHAVTQYEGSGMGLAIATRVAERHGGSLSARSAPGKGSAFTVTLAAQEVRHA